MKVALVHDYLREYGGAERVVEDLHEIFSEAPIYTAYYRPKGLGVHLERIEKWDIRSSWIQKIPYANTFLSPLRILAPLAFESFDFSEYDVVISSCNLYSSKAVLTKPETLHISYIHTPPKMLYGFTTSFNYKKHWYTKLAAEIANHIMRPVDFIISQRPDVLVANSKNTAVRIKKFYRRDAVVIYPAVDITKYRPVKKIQGDYFLSLNRLVRGKGTEITVSACTQLNLPLKVVGSGPELEKLKQIAGPSIEFMGHIPEEDKPVMYAGARALIVATEQEDFGITPVESMAAGTPVIAARSGGYLETVIERKTGEFFNVSPDLGASKEYVDEFSVQNLMMVLKNFNPQKYKENDCRKQAEKFSKEQFEKSIISLVAQHIKG